VTASARLGWTLAAVTLLAWPGAWPARPTAVVLAAQAEVSESDLAQASAGRTIRVAPRTAPAQAQAVPLETYVARVLAGEGEPGAPEAAQQALAVAIRTFALFNAGRHDAEGYDLCDSTHCQVLRVSTAATRRAAAATAGLILTYRAEPAEVFYSASCGGRSESAEDMWPQARLPYLRSVVDDVHEQDVPWTADWSLRDIEEALSRIGVSGRLTDLRIDARSGSDRVTRMRLEGMAPEVMTGDRFRAALGAGDLKSTAFSLNRQADRVRFTGRGYGHGVGMCVIGAGRRAARGDSLESILQQYFPGLELRSLSTSARSRTRTAPRVLAPAAPVPATPVPALSPSVVPVTPPSTRVVVRTPSGGVSGAADIERAAERAHAELSARLGTSVAPITIALHASVDEFKAATGQPWWVSAVTHGSAIDLAPAELLAQREGLDLTVRRAVAELLVSTAVAGRPAWTRVGLARHFARGAGSSVVAPDKRPRCPDDAELLRAVSAVAQREAEARAEACVVRALASGADWRSIR
jgi:stage II sporulation protein D